MFQYSADARLTRIVENELSADNVAEAAFKTKQVEIGDSEEVHRDESTTDDVITVNEIDVDEHPDKTMDSADPTDQADISIDAIEQLTPATETDREPTEETRIETEGPEEDTAIEETHVEKEVPEKDAAIIEETQTDPVVSEESVTAQTDSAAEVVPEPVSIVEKAESNTPAESQPDTLEETAVPPASTTAEASEESEGPAIVSEPPTIDTKAPDQPITQASEETLHQPSKAAPSTPKRPAKGSVHTSKTPQIKTPNVLRKTYHISGSPATVKRTASIRASLPAHQTDLPASPVRSTSQRMSMPMAPAVDMNFHGPGYMKPTIASLSKRVERSNEFQHVQES